MLFRKQCINETEEFDFLKDIVANVEDASNLSVSEEHKPTIHIEDASISCTNEKDEITEDKGQNHKCSISTMLNDEPVTPPNIRSKNLELNNEYNNIDCAFNEPSE